MAGDDIVDAEWEEVPDNRGTLYVAKPTNQAKHRPNPSSRAPSDRRDAAFGLASVGLFFRGLWRVVVVVLGFLALLLIIIAFVPAPEINIGSDGDEASTSTAHAEKPAAAATDGDAKQMLGDWSQAITGRPTSLGFTLIDGSGKPGEFCNSSSGTSVMYFGGRTLPPEHADIYNAFTWLHDNRDTGIVGFYSYDPAAKELLGHDLIEGKAATDRHHDIADIRMKVEADGAGSVTIDGTRYHVCVL